VDLESILIFLTSQNFIPSLNAQIFTDSGHFSLHLAIGFRDGVLPTFVIRASSSSPAVHPFTFTECGWLVGGFGLGFG
jgi:hypothetical protein